MIIQMHWYTFNWKFNITKKLSSLKNVFYMQPGFVRLPEFCRSETSSTPVIFIEYLNLKEDEILLI